MNKLSPFPSLTEPDIGKPGELNHVIQCNSSGFLDFVSIFNVENVVMVIKRLSYSAKMIIFWKKNLLCIPEERYRDISGQLALSLKEVWLIILGAATTIRAK